VALTASRPLHRSGYTQNVSLYDARTLLTFSGSALPDEIVAAREFFKPDAFADALLG
jgi:hypothetical protein